MASNQQSKNPWIFSAEKLKNSPSFRNGVKNEKELHYRQQAANFIQDMGQKLQPNLSDGGSGDNGGRISESSSNRASRRPPTTAAAVPAPAAGSSREENESRTMTTTSASHPSIKVETPKKPSLSLDEYSKRKMHPQMMTGNGGQKHHGEKNPAVPTITIKTEPHGRSHDYRTHHSSESRQQQPHPRLHQDASLRQPTGNTASPAVDKMEKHQRENYLHKQRQQQQRKSNSSANSEHHHQSDKNRGTKEIRNFDSKVMKEMYRREPERLRKYLKHQLPQTRELTPDESAVLHKLEQNEEARRKMKRSSASSAAAQQVPMHTPSLKIKLGPNPSSHDASSRLMSGNTSGSFQQAPRKRAYENSAHAEVSAKYAKRAEDQSKMSKQHHGQAAMNPAHRSSYYSKHSSSAKHSLEASESRKVPHKSEKFQQSNYNANARTNGGSTSSNTTSSTYATLFDRPPSFDNEVPEDLFEPEPEQS